MGTASLNQREEASAKTEGYSCEAETKSSAEIWEVRGSSLVLLMVTMELLLVSKLVHGEWTHQGYQEEMS